MYNLTGGRYEAIIPTLRKEKGEIERRVDKNEWEDEKQKMTVENEGKRKKMMV